MVYLVQKFISKIKKKYSFVCFIDSDKVVLRTFSPSERTGFFKEGDIIAREVFYIASVELSLTRNIETKIKK